MDRNNINSKPCLGFIGLGSIGLPIAANLIRAGFSVKVHTRSRTAENSEELKGAIPCSSPRETAKGCDVLMICVSDENAVEDILFSNLGAESSMKSGDIIIDLSTISPSKARLFAAQLSSKNITYVDAPVTGGTEGAKAGSLTVFLGANEDFLKTIASILSAIADAVYPFGSTGKGQEVKAINQILVAGSYAAVAEAIALGEELKLPMDKVIESLKKGAGSSWALSNRAQSMLQDKYPLGFKLQLHHKDLSIALKTAKDSGLTLPITSKVKELEEVLLKEGYKDKDISVLRRSIKRITNTTTSNLASGAEDMD
ncbi:NAD(P)-dependent oxidoreductase [Prochlorococcus sp. MIT 1223]|uniref:NAD(P)-dependent oxidoreductase n=1 Tax=Prochlorococcus sp. MIT 1223 TaxID=3096217 RepID=UPI002A74EE2E|nr:NAD(P)-dependent oxidoreductase [Prochlorococcus sp. MIT 1223]